MTNQHPYKEWRCGSCGKLLGLFYPRAQILALKYKSLICWIKGECETVCRFCGSKNEIKTDATVEGLLDSADL